MFQLKTLRTVPSMRKENFQVYQRGVGKTRGNLHLLRYKQECSIGEGLIIINDRPCKYKIKSKSLVTEFKIYM